MALKREPEIDYAKSTGAYPMDPTPKVQFGDLDDVDFSKSTGAYPMYDDAAIGLDRVVEHVGSDVADVQFPTPGPVSNGFDAHVQLQRADLGLSADPSGESDQGYEARPSTVPGLGFSDDPNGVEVTAKDADSDAVETKVVKAPAKRPQRGTSGAEGK